MKIDAPGPGDSGFVVGDFGRTESLKYVEPNVRLDFNDLVLRLLKAQERIVAYPCTDYWLDIGRPEDYQQATDMFIKHRAQFLRDE